MPLLLADPSVPSVQLTRMGFALWLCGSLPLALLPGFPVITFSWSLVCMSCSITSSSLALITSNSRFLGPQRLVPENLPFTFHTSIFPPGLGSPSIPCTGLHWDLQPNCSMQLCSERGHVTNLLRVVFYMDRKVWPTICKHSENMAGKA